MAKQIIESANENNNDAVYQLVTQRVKTGFVFDSAPEVNHNCVALVSENSSLTIKSNEAFNNEHTMIVGENYDALKNLLATYVDPLTGEGLIDIIYIDPPYNTESAKKDGNDYKEEVEAAKFVYRDKYTRDGWLNMMNERLKLARKLLSNRGIIYISIDDEAEIIMLKKVLPIIKGEIIAAIDTIECKELKKLLIYRYIDWESWTNISAKLFVSMTTIKRWHWTALNLIKIDEKKEDFYDPLLC